ncbi:MAG: amidohydrolase [Bryobacterales bacterium]|nr:amidohydrolase [Bryobacterales bacterium]
MIFIVALLCAAAWAQTADLVVENANIYTVNRAQPKASAMAVKDGRILAVGGDMGRYKGPLTRLIDAMGATIVPGMIDSHGHIAGLGGSLETLDLREANTSGEAVRAVERAVSTRPKGEWILGSAWDQTRWPGGEFPDSGELSRVSPDHPVYLTRVDGHAAWVNRKALEIADINASTRDPRGGRILRDGQGRPTGILIDRARGLVTGKIPPPGMEQVKARILRGTRECARLGLTGVHDAGAGERELAAYHALAAQGELPVRVYAMIRGAGRLWEEYLKKGPELGDYLTVRGIKLVADGALGSRGAALKEPYTDEPGNRGLLILTEEDIERVAKQAVARGFQVSTHAIGDRANRAVLEAYGAALGGVNDRRFRVEHAQIVALEDFPLFRKFSVIASIQATHATSDMRWAEKRLGAARIKGAYAWQRFLELGARITNGSDFPVESPNPLWGFYAAVTRQDHAGMPVGGWMPEQRLSREEALESWTIDGAYAAFEEKAKGTLEAGKFADFVMLSADIMKIPPAEILETQVRMTVVGGRIVYQERP